MNENTLKKLYKLIDFSNFNEYPDNIEMDLFNLARQAVNELQIENEFIKIGKQKKLKLYYKNKFMFRYSRNIYPNNTRFGITIATDKFKTEKFLKLNNVRTTDSEIFGINEYVKAKNFLINKNEDCVLKPLDMFGGKGVFISVNENNFEYYWKECINIQIKEGISNPEVIIQNFLEGFEIRTLVLEGKFLSATMRVPAHVIGNGKDSIEDLIDAKNKRRIKHAYHRNNLIKINDNLIQRLKYKNIKLDTILNKNEICVLFPQSNVSYGGDNIEVTDYISEELKQLSIKAVAAIPGLHTSGIDIIIKNFKDKEGTVIELNRNPAFLLNYYPIIGEPQNPFKSIFANYLIQHRVKVNDVQSDSLTENELEYLLSRYKYLTEKSKMLSKTVKSLYEENERLKKKLKNCLDQ